MKVLASYLIALATSVLFCTSKGIYIFVHDAFYKSRHNSFRTILRESNFLAYQVEPKLMETLMRLGKVDNETASTQTNQEGSTEAAINPIDDDTTETTPSLSGMLMVYFLPAAKRLGHGLL